MPHSDYYTIKRQGEMINGLRAENEQMRKVMHSLIDGCARWMALEDLLKESPQARDEWVMTMSLLALNDGEDTYNDAFEKHQTQLEREMYKVAYPSVEVTRLPAKKQS